MLAVPSFPSFEQLRFRMNLYNLKEERQMKARVFSNMVASMRTPHHFFLCCFQLLPSLSSVFYS